MTDSKSNGASAGVLAEAYQFSENNSNQGNDQSADGSNFNNDQSADGSSFGNDDNGDNRDNDGNGDNRDNYAKAEDNGDNRDNDGNGDNRDNDSRDQSNQGNEYSSDGDDGNDRNNDNSDNSNQGNEYSSDGDDGDNRGNDYSDNSNQGNEYSSNGDDGNTVTTDVAVDIADSFNDSSETYKDSFNSDDDAIDVSALCAQLEDIIGTVGGDSLNAEGGQALLGDGNVFSIQQIATLKDMDTLNQPNVSLNLEHGASYSLNASGIDGGDNINATQNGANTASGSAELAAGASATADAFAGHESLTMSISMGANTQFTSVDMSVVGGDAGGADFGDA